MPCKPGGYMSHAMQARRLHVSCHASQKATCLMVADHMVTCTLPGKHVSTLAFHTLLHVEKHKEVLHNVLGTNLNLELHMQEQVDTSKACANPGVICQPFSQPKLSKLQRHLRDKLATAKMTPAKKHVLISTLCTQTQMAQLQLLSHSSTAVALAFLASSQASSSEWPVLMAICLHLW